MIRSLSLAPLRYNNAVFEKFFESITTRSHRLLDGTQVFTANVYLKSELVPSWKPKNQLYSVCDGSGTSKYKNEAIYKAISESLERLAFYQNHDNPKYGFDIDCSTNGMAAFPGLFKSHVRKLAFYEAVERWSLQMFWKGSLPLEKLETLEGEAAFHFLIPFSGISSVLVYRDMVLGEKRRRVYGFAASSNIYRARMKARIELDRNFEVFSLARSLDMEKLNLQEKRLIYFSEEAGVRSFNEAYSEALKCKRIASKPRVLIDSPIVGEWSMFCDVHRVLLEGMSSTGTRIDDFLF